jgi:hypothetical protein
MSKNSSAAALAVRGSLKSNFKDRTSPSPIPSLSSLSMAAAMLSSDREARYTLKEIVSAQTFPQLNNRVHFSIATCEMPDGGISETNISTCYNSDLACQIRQFTGVKFLCKNHCIDLELV